MQSNNFSRNGCRFLVNELFEFYRDCNLDKDVEKNTGVDLISFLITHHSIVHQQDLLFDFTNSLTDLFINYRLSEEEKIGWRTIQYSKYDLDKVNRMVKQIYNIDFKIFFDNINRKLQDNAIILNLDDRSSLTLTTDHKHKFKTDLSILFKKYQLYKKSKGMIFTKDDIAQVVIDYILFSINDVNKNIIAMNKSIRDILSDEIVFSANEILNYGQVKAETINYAIERDSINTYFTSISDRFVSVLMSVPS